jgi:hypothetical protein
MLRGPERYRVGERTFASLDEPLWLGKASAVSDQAMVAP